MAENLWVRMILSGSESHLRPGELAKLRIDHVVQLTVEAVGIVQ